MYSRIYFNMDKRTRPSTEKIIPNNIFKVKFGTVNKKNPEVVYIESKTFISPLNREKKHNVLLQKVRREFLFFINETLKNSCIYETNCILDFQVANSGLQVGKKSFLTYQLLLRQNRSNVKDFKVIKNESIDLINNLSNALSLLLENNGFLVSKTKKENVFTV